MLTVVLRTLLFPLTIKQVKSMRAMQDLKPDMDRIRNQYRDNRTKQQEETMKLYQERGVNPLGGCLPILVQMPVFIGIFYVIRKFGGQPGYSEPLYPSFTEGGLFWFQDLSHMDPYFVLPVVSALTMLAATEITAKNIDPQQRWIMRLLPIGVTIFLWRFPAGLFVYWITSNLVTLVQNYLIYNHGPGKKPAVESGKKAASAQQSATSDASRLAASQNGADDPEASQPDDAESRAAKVAKRKRRKKKK
ncbi:MAG: YidC/Oxa1 family membrane protein insertase [Actinomycetota bacterium]|nr:YidC/Oxa1 family membrane protein insertase [Actinomycetota bacterium]